MSALSLSFIPVALFSLAWLPFSPVLMSVLLGLAYAVAQNLIWASITLASPPHLLMLCSGLVGSCLNLLPAAIPIVLFSGEGSADLTVLALVGAVGVGAYVAAAQVSCRAAPVQPGSHDCGLPAAEAEAVEEPAEENGGTSPKAVPDASKFTDRALLVGSGPRSDSMEQ